MTSAGEKTPTEPGSASTYAEYVASLLLDQDATKASVEQRGLAVITTSGVLVTLLFALVALLTKSKDYHLPMSSHGPIRVALVAFVVAAVLALATNLPLLYRAVASADLASTLWSHWDRPQSDALQRLTATRLRILARARFVNRVKAIILVLAMSAEITGVIAVAVAVGHIL